MHWADRREKFRAMLESLRCVYPASAFDPTRRDSWPIAATSGHVLRLDYRRGTKEFLSGA